MAKKVTSKRLLLYAGISLFALLLLVSIFIPITAYPSYTTYSPKPDGTKAVFLLLNHEGLKASRLAAAVPPGRGLMVILEPDSFEEQDWKQALDWVALGNTLLLADDNTNYLYEHFGLNLDQVHGGSEIVPVLPNNPLLKDVRSLTLTGGARLKRSQPMTLTHSDEQGIYLAEVAEGKGRIVLLTLPEIFTNREIGKTDNLILLLNIVRLYGHEGVWFNEFAHGYTWERTTREVFTWPLRLVVIQLALGILFLFYYWGKRFGRPIPLPDHTGQVSGEYVSSLASIYRQGRARRLTLESIYQGFKQDLARYLGAPRTLPTGELVAALSRRPLIDTRKLAELLGRCEALLSRPTFSETDLFAMVREMERWREHNLMHSVNR